MANGTCASLSAVYYSDSPMDAPNYYVLLSALPHMAKPRSTPFILTAAHPEYNSISDLSPLFCLQRWTSCAESRRRTHPSAMATATRRRLHQMRAASWRRVVAARRHDWRSAAGRSTLAAATRSGSRATPAPTLFEPAVVCEAASHNSRCSSQQPLDELVDAVATSGPQAVAEETVAEAPSALAIAAKRARLKRLALLQSVRRRR